MDNVILHSIGLCFCSVCVNKELTTDEIEKEVNNMNPTGISSKWTISKDKFIDGRPNPCKCDQYDDRLHYLMVC